MADPIDINKQIEELMSLQPTVKSTRKPVSKTSTSLLQEYPRAVGGSVGALMVYSKARGAYDKSILNATNALRARGVTEAQIVKELIAQGFDVTATAPTGGTPLKEAGRAIASNVRKGYLPWGKGYENLANAETFPQLVMKGRDALPYVEDVGAGTRLVTNTESALVDAKKLQKLVADGKITPEQALKYVFPKAPVEVADPTSRWVKAGRAYKGMLGGDMSISSRHAVKNVWKGNRIPMVMTAAELVGAGIDVSGKDGLYMQEYKKNMKGPDYAGKEALAVASGVTRSGMRIGRVPFEVGTAGGFGMSGVADFPERVTADETATRLYMKAHKEAKEDGSKLFPVMRAPTADPREVKMIPDKKSLRYQQIYSEELAKQGVPESYLTPKMYKGPEYEYVFGREPRLVGGPTNQEIEEYYAKLAYTDEQNANVTPSMRVNDFMTGLWR